MVSVSRRQFLKLGAAGLSASFRDAGFTSAAVNGQMQAAARITVDYRLDLPAKAPAAQVAEVPD